MTELLRFAKIVPIALVGTYFVGGFVLFCWREASRGSFRDAEIAVRPTSVILGAWIRHYFAWLMMPVVATLVAAGVPPDAITSVSVLFALAAGVSTAVGQFGLGGGLYLAAGICDYLDGRVARSAGKTTSRGAALDSILDRYAEAAMIIGLAWFYRNEWVLLALLMFLAGSFLVPYIRARGESLGIDMKVGLMQRPERLVLLGLSALFSPLVDPWLPSAVQLAPHPLVVATVVLLTVSTQFTAAYRLWYVSNLLDAGSGPGRRERCLARKRSATSSSRCSTLPRSCCRRLAGLAGLAGDGPVLRGLRLVLFRLAPTPGVPGAVSPGRSAVVAVGGAMLSAGGMDSWPGRGTRLSPGLVPGSGAVAWAWNYQLTLPSAQPVTNCEPDENAGSRAA